MYKNNLVFDTSVVTENLGDYIIMDAVNFELRELFKNDFFVHIPTHAIIGKESYNWAKKSDFCFIGGSNILTDFFFNKRHSLWKFGVRDSFHFHNVIGLGVGWQSYKEHKSVFELPFLESQKIIYNNILSKNIAHSVRDSYTQNKLRKLGFNAINTSCVTMWRLSQDHLRKIPKKKTNSVVTTITDYRNEPDYLRSYKKMIEDLLDIYDNVYLWIQSTRDYSVLKKLSIRRFNEIKFIPPSLQAYDEVLLKNIDYVGTRLHAGIRALQFGKRTLIVEVDNRAKEIAKDTNLVTIDYKHIDKMKEMLNGDLIMNIKIPYKSIQMWKRQFINNLD